MVDKKDLGKKWAGNEIPKWEKKRVVLQQATRDNYEKQLRKRDKYYRLRGQRPPLSKRQQICGARRIA